MVLPEMEKEFSCDRGLADVLVVCTSILLVFWSAICDHILWSLIECWVKGWFFRFFLMQRVSQFSEGCLCLLFFSACVFGACASFESIWLKVSLIGCWLRLSDLTATGLRRPRSSIPTLDVTEAKLCLCILFKMNPLFRYGEKWLKCSVFYLSSFALN